MYINADKPSMVWFLRADPKLNVHFTAQTPDRFEKRPSYFEQEFKKHYNGSIHRLIKHSVQEKNFIGSGAAAKVYRIPNMPNFVLRVAHNIDIHQLPNEIPLIPWKELPIDVGQPIMGFNRHHIQILRYQTGEGSKIPYPLLFQKYGLKRLFDEEEQKPIPRIETQSIRPLYIQYLKQVAAMPQQAYDDLARKLHKIGQEPNLFFDPIGSNILIDKNRQTFNLIDLTSDSSPQKNISGMACALIDSAFVNLDEHAIDENGKPNPRNVATERDLIVIRHAILKKALIAAYRTGLDIPKEDWPEIPLAMQKLNGKRRYYLDSNYIFKVSGLSWSKVKTLLQTARTQNMPEPIFLEQLNSPEMTA